MLPYILLVDVWPLSQSASRQTTPAKTQPLGIFWPPARFAEAGLRTRKIPRSSRAGVRDPACGFPSPHPHQFPKMCRPVGGAETGSKKSDLALLDTPAS